MTTVRPVFDSDSIVTDSCFHSQMSLRFRHGPVDNSTRRLCVCVYLGIPYVGFIGFIL